MSLPLDKLEAYKRTPVFTESSIPSGLLKQHNLATGVWGKLIVNSGQLELEFPGNKNRLRCAEPGADVWIQPEEWHLIKKATQVRFYIEFYREKV